MEFLLRNLLMLVIEFKKNNSVSISKPQNNALKQTVGVGTSRAMRTGCANARLQLNADVLLLNE